MTNGGFRTIHLGWILAAGLSLALGSGAALAYTPEQQQACTGDAFRLCQPEIPDVDRVTACMIRNKAQLSPGCRVYFRAGPEPVAGRAGKPLTIKPAASKSSTAKSSTAKSSKAAKKPKKPAAT